MRRRPEDGGDITFASADDFEAAFAAGQVHPKDLKDSLAATINKMIEPVQEHFRSNAEAAQLLEKVRSYQITKAGTSG